MHAQKITPKLLMTEEEIQQVCLCQLKLQLSFPFNQKASLWGFHLAGPSDCTWRESGTYTHELQWNLSHPHNISCL